MATARVVLSDDARSDLDRIWDHLDHEVSPEIADFVISRLNEAMYRATEWPLLHRARPEHLGRPRRINVFSYSIFYEPLPDGDGIMVWRVLHSARDLPRHVRRPR